MQESRKLNELLRMCRERSGQTQQQLAQKLYVDRTTVTKIETGEIKQPSYAIVKEWAKATDSADLIGMDFAGESGIKKLRQMESIFKQMKSMLEPVNFMRLRIQRRKKRATVTR